MKPLKFLIAIIVCLIVSSCDDISDSCTEEQLSSAIVNYFPDSLHAGVYESISIKYIIENSCGSFLNFKDTVVGNSIEVKVNLLYDGCSCDLEFKEDSSYYSVGQQDTGIYHYKFYLGGSDFESRQLVVYQ